MENADLRELLEWYRDAGVDAPLDDESTNRFEQSEIHKQEQALKKVEPPARPFLNTPPSPAPPPVSAPAVLDGSNVEAASEAAKSASDLNELRAAIAAFEGCDLRRTARRSVLPLGPDDAPLVVLGDVPDMSEDATGEPFSGPAGELLERMLAAIGIARDDTLRLTALPWRTPGERTPTAAERSLARPFALRAIELVDPKAVLAMGGTAAEVLLGDGTRLPRARGRMQNAQHGPAVVTFHPNHLLRSPAQKRLAWQDLQRLRDHLAA